MGRLPVIPRTLWLQLAFVAAFFLVGIPFWEIPYSKVSVPNALVAPGLIGLVVLTLILTVFEVASLRRISVVMSLCLPAAVYARVAVETTRDPTSHNLWPFEVVLALFLGFGCVLLGLLIGRGAARWIRKRSRLRFVVELNCSMGKYTHGLEMTD